MSTITQPLVALSASIQTLTATTVAQNNYVPSVTTASEQNRASVHFYFTGSANAFLTFGLAASTASFTRKLTNDQSLDVLNYQGPISVIFSSPTGSLNTTKTYYNT